MKKVISLVLVLIIGLLLVGCGSDANRDPELVGRWRDDRTGAYIEFFSNGTGRDIAGMDFTWTTEEGFVTWFYEETEYHEAVEAVYSYEVDGDTLTTTPTWMPNLVITYTRQ